MMPFNFMNDTSKGKLDRCVALNVRETWLITRTDCKKTWAQIPPSYKAKLFRKLEYAYIKVLAPPSFNFN